MNQEEVRQRLIDLVSTEIECDKDGHGDCSMCEYRYADDECFKYYSGIMVDFFIANGVTIRENEESIANGTTISAKNIKFNTGDFARIVGNKCEQQFALGTIVQLEKHEIDYRATDVNGCYWWVVDDELEPADVADWEGGAE